MIKYSIIIPTCNKNLTKICLEYISKLNKTQMDYEVLVIHNVSNEDFIEVINFYKNKIPNLKYFYETDFGLLAGRKRGYFEARGEILCYLDDDSFVDKNWLVEIEKSFSETNAILVGGNNIPLYESKPPKWLNYFWTETDYGSYMSELSLINFYNIKMKIPTWFVFGCNFIIKKNALFNYNGFNPDVVPKDKQRYQGDGETALSCKLNKNGIVAHFNPKIKIQHYVPKTRMTIEYFKKRAYYQGVCDSFSQIRKQNGFTYFDFKVNNNVSKKIKLPFFKRKCIKILKPIINNLNKKFDNNYKTYLKIKEEYKKSYNEGFNFHQNEVKNDSELLKWVLKENYFN